MATATETNVDQTHPFPFPKRILHQEVNSLSFEGGFDDRWVVGGLNESVWICGICQGLPRRPTILDGCGHLFCEPCVKKHFRARAQTLQPYLTVQIAPCPMCMKSFRLGEVLTFDLWQRWSQMLYKTKQVKCPFECGFQGSPFEVDDHQVYECSRRRIQCPLEGCNRVDVASVIEEHFSQCPMLRVF